MEEARTRSVVGAGVQVAGLHPQVGQPHDCQHPLDADGCRPLHHLLRLAGGRAERLPLLKEGLTGDHGLRRYELVAGQRDPQVLGHHHVAQHIAQPQHRGLHNRAHAHHLDGDLHLLLRPQLSRWWREGELHGGVACRHHRHLLQCVITVLVAHEQHKLSTACRVLALNANLQVLILVQDASVFHQQVAVPACDVSRGLGRLKLRHGWWHRYRRTKRVVAKRITTEWVVSKGVGTGSWRAKPAL
mmetsp:Transcript_39785/g.88426  ORF Transcript_39785/g.88426 Transcript_39785/m.88426 type:complete len:244 (-) Transcript_39785:2620-3351(-)